MVWVSVREKRKVRVRREEVKEIDRERGNKKKQKRKEMRVR